MNIRKYQEKDKNSLIVFWNEVFPDAPSHNEPSSVIKAKLKVAAFYKSLGFFTEDRLSMGAFIEPDNKQ